MTDTLDVVIVPPTPGTTVCVRLRTPSAETEVRLRISVNNDEIVNVIDLGIFKSRFFSTDADADFNGDGVVNVLDLGILKAQFFGPPGPGGTT